MKDRNIKILNGIKNISISILAGIILGYITEYALILNIPWLIKITQSELFWGIIMIVSAFITKKYAYAILNPIMIMTSMTSTYYLIRLNMSGYTNVGGWQHFMIVAIGGSIYIGNNIYYIKEKIFHRKRKLTIQKWNLICMTICLIVFTTYFTYNMVLPNLFYAMVLGIIVGYILGTSIGIYLEKKNKVKEKIE